MQTLTYVIVFMFVGVGGWAIYHYFLRQINGTKLIDEGMDALKRGDFGNAYNRFILALSPTLGTPQYARAVEGLSKAYQLSGADANMDGLLSVGAEGLALRRDSRLFDDGFTSEGKKVLTELKSKLQHAVSRLPQL